MKTESPDRRIARLFEEERLADEASAPDLTQLLERPRRRPEPGTRAIWRIAFSAAALAAMVAAAFLVLRPARPRGHASETTETSDRALSANSLASWKAPTDAFLRTSGADLWSSVPVLMPREAESEVRVSFEPTKGVAP
jgi:hypothetical protein